MTFKIPLGITPLLAVMGCAISGASYFAFHCLTGPEIGLTKCQRKPFYVGQKLHQKEFTKLLYKVI